MKIIITTVYDNIDKEFKDWWIKNCGPNYGMLNWGINPWVIQGNDPINSKITGTTKIKLIDSEGEPVPKIDWSKVWAEDEKEFMPLFPSTKKRLQELVDKQLEGK